MILSSPAFKPGAPMPSRYTCEGANVSPPLEWSEVPDSAQTFALIMDDPDAPDPAAPRRTFVHWVLYDIPRSAKGIAEAAVRNDLARGTVEGINDFHSAGYGGPCPPIGRHRYSFKLYAIDRALAPIKHATKQEVERAIQGHVVAHAELIGTYQKTPRPW